jgi:hypothetical protein
MRPVLAALGLLLLGACAQPVQTANNAPVGHSDLNRFVQPTDGAAYSQSDLYYYTANTNPYPVGGAAPGVRMK